MLWYVARQFHVVQCSNTKWLTSYHLLWHRYIGYIARQVAGRIKHNTGKSAGQLFVPWRGSNSNVSISVEKPLAWLWTDCTKGAHIEKNDKFYHLWLCDMPCHVMYESLRCTGGLSISGQAPNLLSFSANLVQSQVEEAKVILDQTLLLQFKQAPDNQAENDFCTLSSLLNHHPPKVLVGDLKPSKGQLGGDSSLSIHSTVNGR